MKNFTFTINDLNENGKNLYNELSAKLQDKQKAYLSDMAGKMTMLWLNKKEVETDPILGNITWMFDDCQANCYRESIYGDKYVYEPLLVNGVINESNLVRIMLGY